MLRSINVANLLIILGVFGTCTVTGYFAPFPLSLILGIIAAFYFLPKIKKTIDFHEGIGMMLVLILIILGLVAGLLVRSFF